MYHIYNTLSMNTEGDVFAVSSNGKRSDIHYSVKGPDQYK